MTGQSTSELQSQLLLHQTRRQFFAGSGVGLGSIALAEMLRGEAAAAASAADPLAVREPHFPPKATRVI